MPLRVLHCPTDTGRNAWTLAQAERELGLDSTVLVYQNTWLNYPADIDLHMRGRSLASRAATVAQILVRAARDYDVIHFNGGRSLMPSSEGTPGWLGQLDLRLFKAMGKAIVVTYQGCDVRQRDECEKRFSISACGMTDGCIDKCSAQLDAHKRKMVRGFDRFADAIFALNPDLMWVLPRTAEFLPYTTVDLRQWRPQWDCPPDSHFVIVHAPTKRGVKGTNCIIETVGRLKGKYPGIELLLVENVPNAKAMALYRRADLVIDQLLLGWYGGLAVEAMALGKPVLCYLREQDLHFIPRSMRAAIPVVRADSDSLATVLQGLIENREDLTRIGCLSRRFVEHWHDPLRIAARMKALYEAILHDKRKRGGFV